MTETERLRAALEKILGLTNNRMEWPEKTFDAIEAVAAAALNPPPVDGSRLDLLTSRQRAIFEFIESELSARRPAPTVREIGKRFGISSPNGVRVHLVALRKKGLIAWDEYKSRTLAVVEAS